MYKVPGCQAGYPELPRSPTSASTFRVPLLPPELLSPLIATMLGREARSGSHHLCLHVNEGPASFWEEPWPSLGVNRGCSIS